MGVKMIMPKQAQADNFYGNPRSKIDVTCASPAWELDNLVYITPPFMMFYDQKPMLKGFRIHKKCASSLMRIFDNIWIASGKNQKNIDSWGVSVFGGAYCYRCKRGASSLSMHAYAAAIDLNPEKNGFGDMTPDFALHPQVVQAFKAEGWVWGGDWYGHSKDGMHFQAALVD